jgi:hypothetical protein
MKATVAAIFEGASVAVAQTLDSNPDLGGDFVRLAVRIGGLSREEFRSRRLQLSAAIENFPPSFDLERVVIAVSRSAV